jgi:hypothetical protein
MTPSSKAEMNERTATTHLALDDKLPLVVFPRSSNANRDGARSLRRHALRRELGAR